MGASLVRSTDWFMFMCAATCGHARGLHVIPCSLRAYLMPFVQHMAGLHGQPCHATWPRGQARLHDLWVELDHLHSVRGRLTLGRSNIPDSHVSD